MYSLLSSTIITGNSILVVFVTLMSCPAECHTAQPYEVLYTPTVLVLLPLLLICVGPPVQQWEEKVSAAMLDSPFAHLVVVFSPRQLKQSCACRGWGIPEGDYANNVSSVPQKGSEGREGWVSENAQCCNLHRGVKFPLGNAQSCLQS